MGIEAAFRIAEEIVPHDSVGLPQTEESGNGVQPSCGRCGGRLRLTRSGAPNRRVRYCSASCRIAAIRDRRSFARSDLVRALDELRLLHARIERALDTLGLHPEKPKGRSSIERLARSQ